MSDHTRDPPAGKDVSPRPQHLPGGRAHPWVTRPSVSSRPTQHQEHRLPCSSALWVRAEHRGAETLTEDTGLEEPGNWQEDLEEEQQSRCGQIRAHVPHIQHVKASGDRPLQPPRCHHRVERTVTRDTATRHHPSASRGLPAGLCVSGGGVRRLLTCLVPFRRETLNACLRCVMHRTCRFATAVAHVRKRLLAWPLGTEGILPEAWLDKKAPVHPGALPLGRKGPSRYHCGSGMGGPVGAERHDKV